MDRVFVFLLASTAFRVGESFQQQQPQRGLRKASTSRTKDTSSSSSLLILQSFSYLGDLGVEGYGSSTATSSSTTIEPQQAFPIQPQLQYPDETTTTRSFYEDVSLPPPPLIANPYDGTASWIPEESPVTTNTPTPKVSTPVPRPATGAITTINPRTATNIQTQNQYQKVKSIWETSAPTVIQGSSLRTWNFLSSKLEAVQVLLKTNGRPLHANIELWQGEDHTPQKISVYTEDGEARPFSAFLATPFDGPTAIAVKNSANMEFPLKACVEGDLYTTSQSNEGGLFGNAGGPGYGNRLAQATLRRLYESAKPRVVQGDGASYVVPFDESVSRVQILITTEERPLNARIELLQGPNNIKQVIEVSTEDGMARPFFAVLETPGLANAMRIVNTGPVEFPIDCRVEPFSVVDAIDSNYFFDTFDNPQLEQQQTKNNPLNVFTKLLGGRG
ncbi:hypothetical protein IV203_016380 [Nitzschia inconspicua]|uniref:Uncharacterized protein n=1 Tax=Nitzschia inconspicua TaxID=303405 RepID=A0A9K3P7Z8_9STRA|nr:hypothetical protein IV203_017435 [Nitzschia inconspicua]KAG7347675.1 hypothetical protein IV203_016380 [Nitzschia inconspicua]